MIYFQARYGVSMSKPSRDLWGVDFGDSLPFVGIGELKQMHLQPHEFLFGRTLGIETDSIPPWEDNPDCTSTIVTMTRDDVPFAVMSVEGDYNLNYEGNDFNKDLYTVSMTDKGLGHYNLDMNIALTPKQIAKEIGKEKYKFQFQGFPTVFSTVPLAINYTTITEGALNETPAFVGNRLLMDGRLSKISNGVANIPAGEVTEIGPLLNSVINRYENDKYLVTRRLTMSIRMLSYGG